MGGHFVDCIVTLAALVSILDYFGITPKRPGWGIPMPLTTNWKLVVMLTLIVASLGMNGYSFYRALYPKIVQESVDRGAVKEKAVQAECPKPQTSATSFQELPPKPKPVGPVASAQINQKGNGNSANPGTIVGPVQVDPCGVLQNGGSGNQAKVECPPPLKITASAQRQVQTGNPAAPYAAIFTISTNVPAQLGDFKFTCSRPVLSANIDRISAYELSTGNIGPDPADPNTLIYQVKPEPLNPNHFITVKILSKEPLRVLSGRAGDYPITFIPQ